MARQVAIRESYQPDASFCTRLAHAIELDKKRTQAWKAKAIAACNELARTLMDATLPENIAEGGKPRAVAK
jgi:hypothetical protein